LIYTLTRVVCTIIFKTFFRFSVRGRENLKQGPTILVANHMSYMDPPVVGLAVPWPIHYMAKEELFEIPVLGGLIKRLNAFPVKRGSADRQVLKTTLGLLKRGQTVLIFPEGTRSRDGGLAEGMPGAAFMAYKAGARIVPTAIIGTDKVMVKGKKFPRFPKIQVRFGRPIEMGAGTGDSEDKKEFINRTTEQLMLEINNMLQEVSA
jgi:1-acyl-sn-glycerol-3-phosphate acyltransferase